MASYLLPGQRLNVNDQLVPATGRVVLIQQPDGNLVLYRSDNSLALWASNTVGYPVTVAVMQEDGNFVCYAADGKAYWATGTDGHRGAFVIVQDDGNLVVYDADHRPLWASNTVQTWPVMSGIENVSLVKEQSNPAVYLIVGNTKFWVTDPAEFGALGFDWSKVRVVADGSLGGFTEDRLHPAPAVKPSDVFFDCGDTRDAPPFFGTFAGNCKPSAAIVHKDVLVAGWLRNPDGTGELPYVNYDSNKQGIEDIHYNLFLDAVFLDRMYGLNGLSTALANAIWPGNPPAPIPLPFATEAAPTPLAVRGASFNSWILPRNINDLHGELNSWHVNDTKLGSLFTDHFKGRGQQPAFWVNPLPRDGDAWFPFNPLDPEATGEPLKVGDYVMLRGTIWQENNHAIDTSEWSLAPTINHDGYSEMHPPDWVARVRPPNPNARLTVGRIAKASPAISGPQISVNVQVPLDFSPSSPERKLQLRSFKRLVDTRCTNFATVISVTEQPSVDHLDIQVVIQPNGTDQARFKACWQLGWSEVDQLDQVWVDDETPAGATLAGDNEGWDWRGDNVFTGKLSHQSVLRQGMHQHYFYGAATPLAVNYQDSLFAMVFLDPDNPPDEVMLQWHSPADWVRAYWGANLLNWGVDAPPRTSLHGSPAAHRRMGSPRGLGTSYRQNQSKYEFRRHGIHTFGWPRHLGLCRREQIKCLSVSYSVSIATGNPQKGEAAEAVATAALSAGDLPALAEGSVLSTVKGLNAASDVVQGVNAVPNLLPSQPPNGAIGTPCPQPTPPNSLPTSQGSNNAPSPAPAPNPQPALAQN
jgi:hypothetical protein